MKGEILDMKEQILDLYFNKHLKQKEIAEIIHSSQQYISKIVKKDERYKTEKISRKSINSEKRKIAQADYQKNYVRKKNKDIAYEQLLAQQKQDAIELSDYACRKANSSIYHYNSKRNQYVMIKGIKASIDLPRRISVKAF